MNDTEFRKQVLDELSTIRVLLTGNGEPAKGLLIRVDRLEQAEERRCWLMRSVMGSALAALVTAIWALLRRV